MTPRYLDQRLADAARELADARWKTGDAGAAALYTATGRLLTSTFAESPNPHASLCHETGAICEAHKLNEPVVASICISRDHPGAPFEVLPPCGICCERLAYWGGAVEVGVPTADDPTRWEARLLREVQPYYWNTLWPTTR